MNDHQRRRGRTTLGAAVALVALVAACGSDDGDSTSEPTTGSEPAADVVADSATDSVAASSSGLQVTSVDFETGVAVLTNNGDAHYDLAGHWICNRPSYAELPDEVLDPGATIEVSAGGFDAAGGEVAVYISDTFSSSDDIVAYVGWGAGGGRDTVAVEAGIWTGQPVQPEGSAITLDGDPGSAEGWTG